ncbi:hypothetical protein A2U01_0096238, partial [Trifolium medium]|nr:hypothetical protein [Trifolium medium]
VFHEGMLFPHSLVIGNKTFYGVLAIGCLVTANALVGGDPKLYSPCVLNPYRERLSYDFQRCSPLP